MKYFITFLVVALGCLHSLNGKPPKTEKLVVRTIIYCDHCKKCNTCGELLIDRLYDEKGIKSIDLDEKAMTVTVMYNPGRITPEKIREAIARLGYDADDLKATPTGLAALDGCCKKK
jgi:hypothetical protein